MATGRRIASANSSRRLVRACISNIGALAIIATIKTGRPRLHSVVGRTSNEVPSMPAGWRWSPRGQRVAVAMLQGRSPPLWGLGPSGPTFPGCRCPAPWADIAQPVGLVMRSTPKSQVVPIESVRRGIFGRSFDWSSLRTSAQRAALYQPRVRRSKRSADLPRPWAEGYSSLHGRQPTYHGMPADDSDATSVRAPSNRL